MATNTGVPTDPVIERVVDGVWPGASADATWTAMSEALSNSAKQHESLRATLQSFASGLSNWWQGKSADAATQKVTGHARDADNAASDDTRINSVVGQAQSETSALRTRLVQLGEECKEKIDEAVRAAQLANPELDGAAKKLIEDQLVATYKGLAAVDAVSSANKIAGLLRGVGINTPDQQVPTTQTPAPTSTSPGNQSQPTNDTIPSAPAPTGTGPGNVTQSQPSPSGTDVTQPTVPATAQSGSNVTQPTVTQTGRNVTQSATAQTGGNVTQPTSAAPVTETGGNVAQPTSAPATQTGSNVTQPAAPTAASTGSNTTQPTGALGAQAGIGGPSQVGAASPSSASVSSGQGQPSVAAGSAPVSDASGRGQGVGGGASHGSGSDGSGVQGQGQGSTGPVSMGSGDAAGVSGAGGPVSSGGVSGAAGPVAAGGPQSAVAPVGSAAAVPAGPAPAAPVSAAAPTVSAGVPVTGSVSTSAAAVASSVLNAGAAAGASAVQSAASGVGGGAAPSSGVPAAHAPVSGGGLRGGQVMSPAVVQSSAVDRPVMPPQQGSVPAAAQSPGPNTPPVGDDGAGRHRSVTGTGGPGAGAGGAADLSGGWVAGGSSGADATSAGLWALLGLVPADATRFGRHAEDPLAPLTLLAESILRSRVGAGVSEHGGDAVVGSVRYAVGAVVDVSRGDLAPRLVVASNYGWSFLEPGVGVPTGTVNPLLHAAAEPDARPDQVQSLLRSEQPGDVLLDWVQMFPQLVMTGLVVTDPTQSETLLAERANGAPVQIVTSAPTGHEWASELPHRYYTIDPGQAETLLALSDQQALEYASKAVSDLLPRLPEPVASHARDAADQRHQILNSRPHIPTQLTHALTEHVDRLDDHAHRTRHDIAAYSNHYIHARANEAFAWLYTRPVDGSLAADIAYTTATIDAMLPAATHTNTTPTT